MRHWEKDYRGWWRKNPCNTSQCFYGRFLIETSSTDNKHAISLYKPTPQISVTHSNLDTLSRISQRHTAHARTNTRSQMLYRDKHAPPLLPFDIHRHSRTHVIFTYHSEWWVKTMRGGGLHCSPGPTRDENGSTVPVIASVCLTEVG